jgi:GNAT superfamily N-acetyltransferase
MLKPMEQGGPITECSSLGCAVSRQLTPVEWDSYRSLVNRDKDSTAVLAPWSVLHGRDPKYPSNLYALFLYDQAVSWNATYFSRGRKKNGWGRYVNFHLAFTLPEFRRRGYATELARFVEAQAVAQGYHRLKSLCQTYAGYRLHRKLGHHFWGLQGTYHDGRVREGNGKLLIDTPLLEREFPEGVPIEARCAVNAHLWNDQELEAHWKVP